MAPGDLIITPPMSWHGHINESDRRTVWFDATNMPLINAFDAKFFEPGNAGENAFWAVDEGDERLWADAGLAVGANGEAREAYPKFRYPGEATRRLLAQVPAAPDGSYTVRYTNPVTNGSVMPTMDCYAVRLLKGEPTQPRRTTWNAICLVVSGEGRSTIGEHKLDWSQHDVFTIPHWSWASHEAIGGDADLFVVTDHAAFARLELARENIS
jgi:gentisate 1,2-dioxygenase